MPKGEWEDTLFEQMYAPLHNGTETSKAAAKQLAGEVRTVQLRKILGYLRDHGPHCEDLITQHTEINPKSMGFRLRELKDAGLIEKLDAEERTRSGRRAKLWRAKPARG